MFKRLLFTFGLLCALTAGAGAQAADAPDESDDVINTDNPSLTNSSHVVGQGTVQVESGAYYTSTIAQPVQRGPRGRTNPSSDAATADQYQLPVLFRIGLSPDFELRLGGELLQFQGNQMGYSDLSVAFKYRLIDNPDGVSFSVLAGTDLPTGTGAFRGIGITPAVDLIADYPLDDATSLVVNYAVALDQNSNDTPRYLDHFFGGAISHSFNDEVGGYLELVAQGPNQPGGGPFQTVVDAGLSYTFNPNFVLNLAVFKGLSSSGQNWGGYVGYGAKF